LISKVEGIYGPKLLEAPLLFFSLDNYLLLLIQRQRHAVKFCQ